MKRIYAIIALLALAAIPAGAQAKYEGDIKYGASVDKRGETVTTAFTIDFEDLKLGRQEMLVLTPTIRAKDGKWAESRRPIVIAGSKRYRAIMRERDFGMQVFDSEPSMIVNIRQKNVKRKLDIQWNVPYAAWLRDAEFRVIEEVSGCYRCDNTSDNRKVADMLPAFYNPSYLAAFVNPPVEEVKMRSESYVSYVNYQLDKYLLLRNYKNNAQVLDEVDRIMTELTGDPDLTVTKFKVTGYASPEGVFSKNQTLSENRAKAFLNYLKGNFGYNVSSIAYEGRGEDWNGLYKVVEVSDMPDKETVLGIISGEENVAARKRKLEALDGGKTYAYMLKNFYPPLRRNVYEISFIARGFDIAEAKEILRTKPNLLSQNELYLVAETYEKGSPEYKEVFRIAGDTFPDDPYANINYSAIALEEGDAARVIQRLQNINMAEAHNNLGIAYFRVGASELAEKYFRLAAGSGMPEAVHNLSELLKWKENF